MKDRKTWWICLVHRTIRETASSRWNYHSVYGKRGTTRPNCGPAKEYNLAPPDSGSDQAHSGSVAFDARRSCPRNDYNELPEKSLDEVPYHQLNAV